MNLKDIEAVRIYFIKLLHGIVILFGYVFGSECTNVTQMLQLFMDYVYPIVTDIDYDPSCIHAWFCHSLCAALSSYVGSLGM